MYGLAVNLIVSVSGHPWIIDEMIWALWNIRDPKYQKFKIQAQENNMVCLFEEMTKASLPSE